MTVSVYKTQEDFGQFIRLHFARQDIPEETVVSGMLTLKILRAALPRVMQFLRDDPVCRFTQLTDMTCVHYPDRQDCFSIVYHLLSVMMERRLRIVVSTQEDVPVPSVTGIFVNAAWYEREIREMFGVSFEGHPDLRRLLTSDDMSGFPLRRTYPAQGTERLVYDAEKRECVSVPSTDVQKRPAGVVLELDA
ncbi:MAG: NADH-quinone oxidoreductase subunit C [Alphaproteobacteria bacterium]|nr:NADH-quinone oxidoreductase subunit C [Alphaproteobacteria bacterium]